MHTWYYRLNALLTLATTVLAGMCAVASLTEVLHKSHPQVSASVVQVDGLVVSPCCRPAPKMASELHAYVFSPQCPICQLHRS